MAICKVCHFESDKKVCPQCGSSFQMVEWFLDHKRIVYLIALYALSVIQVFILGKVVPTFGDVFNSFGAKLPAPTAFVIGLSHWAGPVTGFLCLFLTALFTLLMAVPDIRRKLNTVSLLVAAILFGITLVLFVVILFMPMFELGNVVN